MCFQKENNILSIPTSFHTISVTSFNKKSFYKILDDHQPVEFCDESTGRPLFTIYPAIGKAIFENGKILYKTLTGDFLFSIIGY